MVVIVIFPDKYLKSCLKGLELWAFTVLPSLLPFFFLTALLTKTEVLGKVFSKTQFITKPLFNLNGVSGYAFAMSVLSGYPVGSRTVYDLYASNVISKSEATRTSVLASTSGPLFVIGAVGTGMFGNKIYGFILYIIHVLSAILTAITFKIYGEKSTVSNKFVSSIKSENILYESIYGSVISVLMVGGFISVFYVLSDALFQFGILKPFAYVVNVITMPFSSLKIGEAVISGLIECTKGCFLLAATGTTPITLSFTAFLISFGGFSIIAQSLVYLTKAEISPKFFCFAKLIQSVYSFIIALITFSLLL